MKSKIQDLIKHGRDTELQELLISEPLELTKGDIDKLIGVAEFTNQSNIANILQKAARSLTKDEGTQCNSLNTTNDTDKEDSLGTKLFTKEEDIKVDLVQPLIDTFVSTLNMELVIKKITEEHNKICAALVNPYQDKDKIKESLNIISEKVDSESEKQVSVFNALFDLAEEICNKPLSTDGRWYDYSEIHSNLQYMHLFTGFLGEVSTEFENIDFSC